MPCLVALLALISPRLRERIQELGVELTHFGVVPTAPSTAQTA